MAIVTSTSSLSFGRTVDIEVKVIDGRVLDGPHHFNLKPSYFVELEVNQDIQTTSCRRNGTTSTKWDESFIFVCGSSTSFKLDIRIFCHHRRVRKDHIIAAATLDILKEVQNGNIEIELHAPGTTNGTKRKGHARLTLHLKVAIQASFFDDAASDFDLPLNSLEMIGLAKCPTPEQFRQISPGWKRFIMSLNTFCKLAEAIAELSPKAKVAVGAVSFAVKIMIDQINRDEKIMGLIGIMTDLYQFFLDADPMQKILIFKKIVDRLFSQTTECFYFIADYLKTMSAAQRAVMHIVSNADFMIQQFEGAFGNLKIELILGTSLQVAVVSFRILDKVQNIVNLMFIDHLPYSKSAGWDLSRACLRGTRQIVIDEVIHWASDSEGSRVYLLFGPPGCGKSAIAHTIAHVFHQQGRLGAGVFLDSRCVDREVNSQTIACTVAFQLASYDPRIKERMAEKLSSSSLLASADTERLFPELIISTIENLAMVGPTVVVIDGLPDLLEQRRLLTVIVKSSAKLPPNIRIVLTSRPDSIIPLIMDDQTSIVQARQIGFHDASEVGLDVSTPSQFVELCLDHHIFSKDSSHLSDEYNRQEIHELFMRQALGLDFWISTVYSILSRCNTNEKRTVLNIIKAQKLPQSKLEAMGNIYHAFLNILPYPPQFALNIFGTLINSSKPIVLPKASLLEITVIKRSSNSQENPLLGLHPCFEDLLTDLWRLGSNQDQYFYCDWQNPADLRAGEMLLDEMNRSLKHNLLELEDIMVLNSEVLDLRDRISKFIPVHLQYACCNWAIHIEAVKDPTTISAALREFLFTHLLHWFEAMSFLSLFDLVLPSLERLYNWLKGPLEYDLCQLTADGIRFIQLFSPIISQAALQTYVSALPLMPPDILLFDQYHDEPIADRSYLMRSYDAQWTVQSMPAQMHMLRTGKFGSESDIMIDSAFKFGSKSAITAVAYHGFLIAIASQDNEISFYDLWSGQVHPTIQIDADQNAGPQTIEQLVLSPDGRHITTTTTTRNILGPWLQQPTNQPIDGAKVEIWEVSTGRAIYRIQTDYPKVDVSYSDDGTKIMLWDIRGSAISIRDVSDGLTWIQNDSSLLRGIHDFQRGWLTLEPLGEVRQPVALFGNRIALADSKGYGSKHEITIKLLEVESQSQRQLAVDSPGEVVEAFEGWELHELLWSSDGHLLAGSVYHRKDTESPAIYLWSSFGSAFRRTPTMILRLKENLMSRHNRYSPFSWGPTDLRHHKLAFSSNGSYLGAILLSRYENYGQVGVWDTSTGELLFQKELKSSFPPGYSPSLSFLPDNHEIIIHWNSWPEGSLLPIRLVNFSNSPGFPQSGRAPIITYSHLSPNTMDMGDFPTQVDSDGWIINRKGVRQMWVPYPKYKVSIESQESGYYLRVRHPDTKKTVLKFNIHFGSKD